MRQRSDGLSGGSFSSSDDQRVHFGSGQNAAVEQIGIHWPSGPVERLSLASIDRLYGVEEGKGIAPSVYDQSGRKSPGRMPF
jgi:hypothetical protein